MEARLNRLWPVVVALTAFAACGPKIAPVAPGAERAVYEIGDEGIELPSLVEHVKPKYTPEAKEAQIAGEVWLNALIDREGSVAFVEVTRSLDDEFGLDETAMAAVRQWRFSPGTRLGEPVPVLVNVSILYSLSEH